MLKFTSEMIEKAKVAKTAEELVALAKENHMEMTAEEAKNYMEQLHPTSGELSDDELDNVAGGGCGDSQYTINEGDRVRVRQECSYNCLECKGRTGVYQVHGKYWDVKCDAENCTGYVIRNFADTSLRHRIVYKI